MSHGYHSKTDPAIKRCREEQRRLEPQFCKSWARVSHIEGCDSRTSTGVGHKYKSPVYPSSQVFAPKIPIEPIEDACLKIKRMNYSSAYKMMNENKYNEVDPMSRGSKSSAKNILYIARYGDGIVKNPPNPSRTAKSEYKQQFPGYVISPFPNERCNSKMRLNTFCKVESRGKDEQPALSTSEGGSLKHLDLYISTTHLNHHPFASNDVQKYQGMTEKVTSILSTRVYPIYDECVVGLKFNEIILPKTQSRVPHSGIKSEMKDGYGCPLNELVTITENCNDTIPAVAKASKSSILTIPGMYHTEYSHLGTGWPLKALIK